MSSSGILTLRRSLKYASEALALRLYGERNDNMRRTHVGPAAHATICTVRSGEGRSDGSIADGGVFGRGARVEVTAGLIGVGTASPTSSDPTLAASCDAGFTTVCIAGAPGIAAAVAHAAGGGCLADARASSAVALAAGTPNGTATPPSAAPPPRMLVSARHTRSIEGRPGMIGALRHWTGDSPGAGIECALPPATVEGAFTPELRPAERICESLPVTLPPRKRGAPFAGALGCAFACALACAVETSSACDVSGDSASMSSHSSSCRQ